MKWYGILGIFLIILVELNFFFQIQPFANWYFPIIWFGYILVVDSIIFQIRGKSIINNKPLTFISLIILSSMFWWFFELTNIFLQNWNYLGTEGLGSPNSLSKTIFGMLSFGTVLPALFETTELIRSIHLFDKIKLKKKFKIKKASLYILMILGIVCFFLPIFFPKFAFPLIWLSFFLIFDPINYLNNQPSIIGHLKNKRIGIILSLLLAGITLGFFWEFWNHFAIIKWTYDVPYVGFLKIFEMPILGYLGYFPFALELYAMYWFFRSLFLKKEKLLIS
jgi:hypothetical protein